MLAPPTCTVLCAIGAAAADTVASMFPAGLFWLQFAGRLLNVTPVGVVTEPGMGTDAWPALEFTFVYGTQLFAPK